MGLGSLVSNGSSLAGGRGYSGQYGGVSGLLGALYRAFVGYVRLN